MIVGPSTPQLSAEERQERKKKFEEFISRQQASETKKKVHQDEVCVRTIKHRLKAFRH
jgi:hypothetical protein